MQKEYKISNKDLIELTELNDKLEELFEAMIVDLHKVKGGAQPRIAYIYYRDIVWQQQNIIRGKMSVIEVEEIKTGLTADFDSNKLKK